MDHQDGYGGYVSAGVPKLPLLPCWKGLALRSTCRGLGTPRPADCRCSGQYCRRAGGVPRESPALPSRLFAWPLVRPHFP